MSDKIIIYQVMTRLFGNRNMTHKENGTIAENGCGKFQDFTSPVLNRIRDLGVSHIWYTGVIRHAEGTDYEQFGLPRNHPSVVKGRAGSPYAITDYYDVDPDLAVNVDKRMDEFTALVNRTHKAGMKVIIDFVPNHVAREYHSLKKPQEVKDLGEQDDKNKGFDPQNNFYYCVGQNFEPQFDLNDDMGGYSETPAKATGNDQFTSHPGRNDWYETVKLNYGVDYCDAGGRSYYFIPTPDTWLKMSDILHFWASNGVDGFRCDMVEMVPSEFWFWAINKIRSHYPHLVFIGEVYNPSLYEVYVRSGFDYLYDKVGMYDTVRNAICGGDASQITYKWQSTNHLKGHMLYFLENHDEQRIASDFFAGSGKKGIPGMVVSALLQRSPVMIYAGQEFGERGMDKEGFSGRDGRTTIFDYWSLTSLYHGFFSRRSMTAEEKELSQMYARILHIAKMSKAVTDGEFFDLMYVNPYSDRFNPYHEYAFMRKYENEVLLVIANFSQDAMSGAVTVPKHAFDYLGMTEGEVEATDLLTGEKQKVDLKYDSAFPYEVHPYSGRVYKFEMAMIEDDYEFNEHHKEEFPPAHTAEHLLNQTMMRMFGCERSKNAHIERKKSKISYILDHKPDRKEEKAIEQKMNELIEADMPVTFELVDRHHIPEGVSLDKLPADASEMIRLVRIGDYDVCPCIGRHVRSTRQIGRFHILGTNWDEEKKAFRIRFKVVQ